MIIHFSSVHTFILTLPIDVAEMEFAKMLRNLNVISKNDPYRMRPVESAIRTAERKVDGCGVEGQTMVGWGEKVR
jgi:hypothetical protein